MTRPIKSVWLFLLGLLGLHSTSAFADSDVLCIQNVTGDSTVVAGCIDILSWSWGGSNSTTPQALGKVNLSSVSFMKLADSASDDLFSLLISSKTFTAQYSQYKNCCLATPYLTIHFNGAFVQSWQSSASTETPSESLSLDYGEISYCYKPSVGAAQCSAFSKLTGASIDPF